MGNKTKSVLRLEQVENLKVGDGKLPIPKSWGAQIQLSLEVDESVSLNPGVTFTQLLPGVMKIFGVFPNKTVNSVSVAQSFALGFGATLSSEALRTDKFNTYYSIKDLRQKAALHRTPCQPDGKPDPKFDPLTNDGWTPAASSPLLIQSELGLKDWLVGAMFFDIGLASSQPSPASPGKSGSNSGGSFAGTFTIEEGPLKGKAKFSGTSSSGGKPPSGSGKPPSGGGGSSSGDSGSSSGDSGFKQDSFTQEIKFIIISTGNITPTWKLIQLSANTANAPFFSTGRTRTHDLIITIGPPTQRTNNDFLASQINQSLNRATR
jgi:hypothetical protein